MIKFMIQTTKGFRLFFALLLTMVLLGAFTSSIFPIIIGKIVDVIFYEQDMRQFFHLFLIYTGIYIVNQVINGGLNYAWGYLKVNYLGNIKRDFFKHILRLKSEILLEMQTGDITQRLNTDVEHFMDLIHNDIFYSMNDLAHLIIIIGYLFFTSYKVGCIVLILTPLFYCIMQFFRKKIQEVSAQMKMMKGNQSTRIMELVHGIEDIKYLNAFHYLDKIYLNSLLIVKKEEIKIGYTETIAERVNTFFLLVGKLLIFAIAVSEMKQGTMTLGQFTVCIGYYLSCSAYFTNLNARISDIASNQVSVKRIMDVMSLEEEKEKPYNGETAGQVVFDNVFMKFGQQSVFQGLSLDTKNDKYIALVGKSGCGKSTILNMILGILYAKEGNVFVGNVNVKEWNVKELRKQIGVVQQNTSIFYGRSIRYNICFYNDSCEDDRIYEILQKVNLETWVHNLPDGLDTIITMQDQKASGGQLQRISIARMIYKKPKMILMDEATSALDGETENTINQIMEKEFGECLKIVVAHRLSTIKRADRILVIDDGKLLADGTHWQLQKECELYREICRKGALYEEVCSV